MSFYNKYCNISIDYNIIDQFPSMDYQIENTHICRDCGMKFYNSHQLVNHMKRFCVSAGLDSLEGLAQYNNRSHKRSQAKKQQESAGALKYEPDLYSDTPFTQNAQDSYLNKSPIAFNRPCSNKLSYLGNQKIYSPELRSNTNLNQVQRQGEQRGITNKQDKQRSITNKQGEQRSMISKHGSRVFADSEISIKPLDNFGVTNPDNNYYSPPSQMPFAKYHNNVSLLDKSNTSIADMTKSQKKNYATDKLLELDQIAEMYDTSGGINNQFRNNVDKMRKFYRKMLNDEGLANVFPAEFAESRVQTPINKLRNIQRVESARDAVDINSFHKQAEMKKSQWQPKSQAISKSRKGVIKGQQTQQKPKKAINSNPPSLGYPYQQYPYPPYPPQPQIIMLPPYQNPNPQQTPNVVPEQIRYLERIITMKNSQNQKLMQMLINSKNSKNPQQFKQNIKQSQCNQNISKQQQKYYFQNAMNNDLNSEQKILIAMQREQLDQLRLLSSLPEHLQQIKMQSVIKLIEARTELEKQILQQKVKRLEEQQRVQQIDNQRKIQNNQWVSKQKRSIIQEEMKGYLAKYQQRLQGNDSSENQEEQKENQQS